MLDSQRLATLATTLLAFSTLSTATATTTFDADCGGEGYTGFALKLGTQCRSYVYCSSGVVTSTTVCPGSLIYDGNVGVGGVCGWPDLITCADEEVVEDVASSTSTTSTATTTTTTSSKETVQDESSISVNVDTEEANVLAQLLNIDSSPSPPSASVITAPSPPTLESAISSASISIDMDTEQANALAQIFNTDPSPTPPTTTDNVVVSAPSSSTSASSYDPGFCGGSKADAESKCAACIEGMCSSSMEACWYGTSCDVGSSGSSGSGTDASATVLSQPSSTTTTATTTTTTTTTPATTTTTTTTTSTTTSSSETPQVLTYDPGYCGGSKADAESKCIPCVERACDDFMEACWVGTSCNGSSGSGGNVDSSSSANDVVSSGSSSANDVVSSGSTGSVASNNVVSQPSPATTSSYSAQSSPYVSSPTTTLTSIQATIVEETIALPTKSPTLPPWTNAPFTPYRGPRRDKIVTGYYASWQWYDREKAADPVNIDWSKYDRINYAFFQIDREGAIFGTDEWADPQLLFGPYVWSPSQQSESNRFCSWDGPNKRNCNYHDTSKGIMHLAHAAGATVLPSIGGWTLSDNFPTVAANPRTRKNFARSCVRLIEEYGFDGIDIDWEYPGYKPHKGTDQDKFTYTLLLQEIRDQLDELGRMNNRHYKLTAALPCGPDKIDDIEVDKIKDILCELNLMTYDLHGAWDMLTGINAPMTDQGWTDKTKRWSVHGCTNAYADFGVPMSKINIGLPFYGRSFRRATGMKQLHDGVDDINFHLDEGSPQYFNIVSNLNKMTTYRHENTQTQYAVFNSQDGGLVTYDDPRAICDKVHYANERGLNGFIVWEISGDMLSNGQTPLIDATNDKIRNPSLNCSRLRDPLWSLSSSTYFYAPDEPDEVDLTNAASFSSYNTEQSTGSTNDFNGAQEETELSRPASLSTDNFDTSSRNQVYTSDENQSEEALPPGSDGTCPSKYTGYWTTADCTQYFQCQDGILLGAAQPCVPGTLFDVEINTCDHAVNVAC